MPPAERWLPTNTVAFVTAPDAGKLRAAWESQAPGRLWADPAMDGFRAHTVGAAEQGFWEPLSKLTGLQLARLPSLAEGQVTLALVEESDLGDGAGVTGAGLPWRQVLLLDAGKRSEELAAWLAGRDPKVPGSQISISGIDFLHLRLPSESVDAVMRKILPEIEPESERALPPAAFHSLFVGRKDSTLLASTSSNALVRILDVLAESPPTAAAAPQPSDPTPDPRVLHGTLVVPPFLRSLSVSPLALGGLAGPDSGPSVAGIAAAFGLNQLRSLSLAIRSGAEGWHADLQLAMPASSRKGIFGMFSLVAADSTPPPSIPAEAETFVRARFAGKTAWNLFEGSVREVDSAFLGVLQLFTGYAGKTEDADFDFQKGLIDLLGNDWMHATLPTGNRGDSASLALIGSPNAADLFKAFRLVAAPTYLATFFPPGAPNPKRTDRLLEGRPITSIALPPMPWTDGSNGAVHVHFTHQDSHVGFSSDAGVIESLVSSPTRKPLAERPGLREAILQAGGGGNGYLAYTDERRTAAKFFRAFSRSSHALTERLPWIALSPTALRFVAGVESWIDPAQVPPFEQVAAHFGDRITSGKTTREGFEWTTFRPRPASAAP